MITLREGDCNRDPDLVKKVRTEIKGLARDGKVPLSIDPFSGVDTIAPTVAEELKNSTIKALIVSWILIIGYIAVRFYSWKFGVAAVVALIHDALITVGIICLCVMVVPKALGLNFAMSQVTVAAILTIIGYSVNDTIVTFDRVRENLVLMKREPFDKIVNVSINQTLPRTILTSLTTWITVIILWTLTMKSGTGIATFAFPLVVGLLIGTYSSVFIAAPIVVGWFKDKKPVIARK
jgi:preprotein translocase SecF subunit